jgi:ADP-ribose pyrophosphatase YjhB (NUDIX family)
MKGEVQTNNIKIDSKISQDQMYDFQFCQKIVVFSNDKTKVLLAKRKGEQDYNGIFSFIGGKMEVKDKTLLNGLKREKDEEVGRTFHIRINSKYSFNLVYVKKNGKTMILPHYFAVYDSGEINLNEEYSEFKWIDIASLASFEPKVETVIDVVNHLALLQKALNESDFVVI